MFYRMLVKIFPLFCHNVAEAYLKNCHHNKSYVLDTMDVMALISYDEYRKIKMLRLRGM